MDKYIVSARKYRPSSFDAVVGQSALTTTLKNAIARGKLAHAYLFCGPRGVGKTTCARIFAKNINCLHPSPEGEACNECESCKAFEEQRSYNIHELDAASNNSVEDIRGLIEQVQIPPQVGKYKVFIIDEVHMLSQAAFNAFLKTLEEPPAHAIFILATTEKHKILPTILSRCQIFDFSRMSVSDMVRHLEYVAKSEGFTTEPEALHVIAEKADGGMRDALSIFDQVASYCEGNITYAKVIEDLNVLDYDEYFGMTDALLAGDVPTCMLRLNHILSKGFGGNYFIGGLASHFRDLLMARDAVTLPLLEVSERVAQRYQEQATKCKPAFLYKALKLCNDCDLNYRASRNKRLLVELTLIQVAQLMSDEDAAACGRSPKQMIKPLFQKTAAPSGESASHAQVATASSAAPVAVPPSAAHASSAVPAGQTLQEAAQPYSSRQTAPASPVGGIASLASPKPTNSSKSLRHPQSLSLKSLAQKAQQGTLGNSEQPATTTATPTHVTDNPPQLVTPFTQDTLMYYWFRYIQILPQEQTAMAGRMKGMTPELQEGWVVHLVLENEMVEQEMQHMLPNLQAYLRTQLRNDLIQIKISVSHDEVQHKPTGRADMLRDLTEQYHSLAILCERLNLELA
ncbi:MAG: DNA polymerase III subunit gamma/tau [Bacteroidales bacterium]|nr:DNA polymerase III subunit gamma/tau [Bacteroidales bacterium]